MDKKRNNRWFDQYQDLPELLEKLKDLDEKKRTAILIDLKNLIMYYDAELIDKHVLKFSMNEKRRWYDEDPNSWLIINTLYYADVELIKNVIQYLKENL